MTARKPEKTKDLHRLEDQIKELGDRIGQLEGQKQEIFEKLQRVSADYANFQKRVSKQIAEATTYEKEVLIRSLLPVLDNFEHTLQNTHSADSFETLAKGVRIIYDQMLDILKSYNVEQVATLGEKFDPSVHQAVMQRYEADKQDNIVLGEFAKGYKLDGRLIRPARVVINTAGPQAEGGEDSQPPQEESQDRQGADEQGQAEFEENGPE